MLIKGANRPRQAAIATDCAAYQKTIFAGYGGLHAWDWEVAGEPPRFTMATQWDETDHNYLCRRWEVAGYGYWYEHSHEGHTLKVSDDTTTPR